MSGGEAALLLRSTGLDPDLANGQAVIDQAEGWPAAVVLAALACTSRPPGLEASPRCSGDDHVIAEYFRSEVLDGLSPGAVGFLTHTSILDRLSGSLCDEVLGRRRSAGLLVELVQANVPLAPVDPSHEWYRLHGLFREMLQTELRRSEPGLIPALHRRAEAWYLRNGDVERALDHVGGRADDLDRAGELLWGNVPRYLGEGRSGMVQGWLRPLSVQRAARCLPIALVAAHSSLASGRMAIAEQWARSAAVASAETPGEGTASPRAGGLIIDAWAARSGAGAMADLAARGYDLLADDDPWRASCCFLRGTAALLTGHEHEAERWLEQGVARGVALARDTASLCLAQLAVLTAERDQGVFASDFARRAQSVVAEHELAAAPASALVFAVCAQAAMLEGRVDEAKADVSRGLALLDAFDDVPAWFGAETQILLARAALALGDVTGARALLAEASRLSRRTPDVVIFERWFDSAWDQFDQHAEGVLAGTASLTTAELRVLRFLPTHYSFYEIAQRLHVSANTVKTHVHAVYRKLDASSRSEAVAQAIRAGLLSH
jgi:LuxR family maltose regulon positive regulatory protein